ncbi:MAG TPA: HprK-related kinase A [Gammaproteobacteria bacterium]|nr:HprK-related kinase A [Gammaproteobacteria bacterium]
MPTRIVGDLGPAGLARLLRGEGVGVRLGPFDVRLRSGVAAIEEPLFRLYRDYSLLEGERVFNIHLELTRPAAFSRRVRLLIDGRAPHADLPIGQALAVLEWGLNLAVALRSHSWLMLHSAAVERAGEVMLFPAWPGAGKTTLCAGLVHRGWRLFSDEFGLIRLRTREAVPLPRPMPLKNASIDVIRAFAPDAELGPTIPNTRKGTIAHVKPPSASIRSAHVSAPVRWIVFPQWLAGAPVSLDEMARVEAFMTLAANAFNYEMLGEEAFAAVGDLVATARCFRLQYSNLEDAVALLRELVDRDDARR